MAWKPRDAPANFRDTLHEGVPVWMKRELETWRRVHFATAQILDLGQRFDSESRNDEPIYPALQSGVGFERLFCDHSPDVVISFLDYILYIHGVWADDLGIDMEDEQRVEALEGLLERSGSEWKVGTRDGNWGLERRVPEGVQTAADHVVTTAGSAGALLAEAWHAAFGTNPDSEEAYEKAIKAVEEAGAKVVLPDNPTATLGQMINTLMSHGNWTLEVTDKSGAHFNDVVLNVCVALWKGQPSRHGGNGYRKPTQGEAEAAVMLAVPLVQWFHSGAVARRP